MTKQEFIIETLEPYFLDKNICANEREWCVYLTQDGRMCAVGKHLDTRCSEYSAISICQQSISSLATKYGLSNILKKSSQDILSVDEWTLIQSIHDRLSEDMKDMTMIDAIVRLEVLSETNLGKLRQYCKIDVYQ